MKKLWFRRRLYGWGWYPSSWQGWVIMLAYLLLVILFALTIHNNSTFQDVALTFLLPTTILTILFIRICYAKGEKPRWQWGKRKK